MRNKRWRTAAGFAALGATAALGTAALIATAQAQQQDRPGQPPPPGGGFPGGGRFGGGMMMMPVMTATDKYVYILRGNTLYQFDAGSLTLVKQADLPRPAGGPGRRPGGDGAGAERL